MGAKKSYLVTLIPGDGIGPAVTKARVGPVIGASVAPCGAMRSLIACAVWASGNTVSVVVSHVGENLWIYCGYVAAIVGTLSAIGLRPASVRRDRSPSTEVRTGVGRLGGAIMKLDSNATSS